MDYLDISLPEEPRPAIWNPGSAAAWSLLLSPAFGSILHGLNWQRLGDQTKAMVNFGWAIATAIFLAANLGLMFVPDSKMIEGGVRIVGFAMLLGWYFSIGKRQADFVRERFGEDYPRRGWAGPLLIAFAVLFAYVGGAVALGFATYRATPQEIAEEVRPQILAEWRKNPQIANASIQKIDLTSKDGKIFDGTVQATLNGQPTRLSIHVVVDGWQMQWEVMPIGP